MESELAELNANLSRLQLNFLPKSDFITDDSIDPTDQEIEVEPPLPFSYPDTSTSNQEDIIELEELFRSRLNSSPQPIKITTTTSSSSEEPSMPATTAVIKHNLTQPSFKLRYASDCTLSFTLCSPLTPLGLKNIFIQHQTLKFAYFQAGIISDQVCFDFHGSLCLPFLKKITFQIPASPSDHTETGLPHDFKRLLHLLQLITYGRLECLRFDCDPLTAIRIPLISAFLPSYEPEDSHPLSDLILKNRDTLHSIVIGPTLQEMVIRTNPAPCPGVCEPANYPKIESFTYFPDVPILPSLSPILRVQKHLTKLIVTLSHIDVWYDVCHAIRSSCNNLESFGFNLVSLDEEAAIVDLKILRVCEKLKELSIQFEGCNVIGWGFIPRTVTTLNFLGGQLTNANTELMSLALPNLEDVNMFLAKPAHQKSCECVYFISEMARNYLKILIFILSQHFALRQSRRFTW